MKPFRQGNLDATCGLYAIVNSVRAAARPISKMSVSDCAELYQSLVHDCDDFDGGFATVLCEGLCIRQMKTLLKHASYWLLHRQEIRLVWSKPYTSKQKVDLSDYRTVLQSHLELGGSAILGLWGYEEHWTVLNKLTAKSIMLHDSGGMKRLFAASLDSPRSQMRSPWQVDPNSTFLMKVAMINAGIVATTVG